MGRRSNAQITQVTCVNINVLTKDATCSITAKEIISFRATLKTSFLSPDGPQLGIETWEQHQLVFPRASFPFHSRVRDRKQIGKRASTDDERTFYGWYLDDAHDDIEQARSHPTHIGCPTNFQTQTKSWIMNKCWMGVWVYFKFCAIAASSSNAGIIEYVSNQCWRRSRWLKKNF